MLRDFQDFESLCKAKIETNPNIKRLLVRQITNVVLLIILQIFSQILFFIIFLVRFIKTEKKIPKIFVHSLTKDQIFRNGSTDELFHFLEEKRFPYSSDASDYLIYCKNLLLPKESRLKVTRSLSLHLIIYCFNRQSILTLSKTMINLMAFTLRKKTGLTLESKYFLYYFVEYLVWTNVTSESKIKFITTQSSHKNLPILFYLGKKNFERHMMWYSTNSIPIYKVGKVDLEIGFSQNLATYIDLHLVWDNFQVSFLEKQKIYNSRAYGSMLFYPRKFQKGINNNSTLIYFDVIPTNLFENNFYSTEMALRNLEGIISVINKYNDEFDKNLRLKIKHKRIPNRKHSAIYLNYVKRLINCGAIEAIVPTENLYRLISESRFVIGTPYTSPVIVAKELDVNSSFICFGSTEFSIPDYFNEVLVIKDENGLLNKLIEFI
jgi:hypothetical protein